MDNRKMEKDERYKETVTPQQDEYYTQLPSEPSVEEFVGVESVWSEDMSQEKEQSAQEATVSPTDPGSLGTGPFRGGRQQANEESVQETCGSGGAEKRSQTEPGNDTDSDKRQESWTARAQAGINVPGTPDPRASIDSPFQRNTDRKTHRSATDTEAPRDGHPAHREPDDTTERPPYREPEAASEPAYREPQPNERGTDPGYERREEPGTETETVIGPNASARMEASIGAETDTGPVTNPVPDSFFASKQPKR